MLIDHEYVNCPIRFDDRIRPANLLPIHMLDFDVILGMDWLASHRATIDCYARTVIFGNVHQPEFVYHGSSPLKSVKLISAMKARTLISHGCQGFLASVMDTSLESPNIENLSVVREFADVFPDELPGLPPLMRKGEKFVWTDERQESFEELKRRLVSAPILTLPSGSGGFQIYSDASKKGLGCVLMQHGKSFWDVELSVRGLVGYWASMEDRVYRSCIQIKEDQGTTVKIEHQRASGFYSPLEIRGKWDEISMDFVTGLPTTQKRHDAIWVVVDRLTKSAHFLPIRKNYGINKLAGDCSTENFGFLDCMKALREKPRLKFSTAFHPQTDGQSERTIQLGRYVRLIEITNEKVAVAKEKLKEARSRQKSYADKHRRDLEFQVGDRVFLKILERIGEVSYRLALPPQLSHVHDVFHVSLLRGYHYHPLHVASYPFDQIQPDMSLSEEPESILDRQERVMRNKVIPFVKILWKNHPEREATLETEESMRASYPHSLSSFVIMFYLNPAMLPLIFEPLTLNFAMIPLK
ncbi:putative nucleotidyltransferase, ribonuclease H [Tanacetum coccineum]